jgi:hypothetical protein
MARITNKGPYLYKGKECFWTGRSAVSNDPNRTESELYEFKLVGQHETLWLAATAVFLIQGSAEQMLTE